MPGTTPEIQTFGHFSISIDGEPVAADWPNEAIKLLFCSLLSPLDLYITWDRICRSMWGEPATRASRHQLEESCLRPLNSFLIKELAFNPLMIGQEGIRINHQGIHVDAHEFHRAVMEGFSLLSLGNQAASLEKFCRAETIYAGSYLTGLSGKIIESTRKELESLYRSAVMEVVRQTHSTLHRSPKSLLTSSV